jgi:hypothetical protein
VPLNNVEKTADFCLYNLQGQLVHTWKVKAGMRTNISIKGIARGVYFGKVMFAGKQSVAPIFVSSAE